MSRELFDRRFVHFMWEDELLGKKGFVADVISELRDLVNKGTTESKKYACVTDSHDQYPFSLENEEGFSWNFFYYDPLYIYKVAFNEGKTIQIKNHILGDWQDLKNESFLWGENADTGEYRIKPEEPDTYVVLRSIDNKPALLWKYCDEKEEKRHIYFKGTSDECMRYIESHSKFAPIMKAWEEGKTVQLSMFDYTEEDTWTDIGAPSWDTRFEYRIKPEEPKPRRITYRELAEWAIKQNGEIKSLSDPSYVSCIFSYLEGFENEEIPEGFRLRRWGSDEWIEPTVDVYEADCKGE